MLPCLNGSTMRIRALMRSSCYCNAGVILLMQLHIRRIHVRIEDHHSGDHPFAVGLTIESVHVQVGEMNSRRLIDIKTDRFCSSRCSLRTPTGSRRTLIRP